MKKSELFTKEMVETFTCHPYAIMLAYITRDYNHLYFE